MKKLLLIACLLPFAGFAQIIFKDIKLPKIPIDSVTRLRTYRASEVVEGSKKDKLAIVLNKWFASSFTASGGDTQAIDSNIIKINGEGTSVGSFSPKHLTAFQSAPDKLTVDEPTVYYKIKFTVKIIVTNGKYSITLTNYRIEVFDVITPLEQYYTNGLPTLNIPGEHFRMDITEMYSRIFEDIDNDTKRVAASASKYVAKAKKKGDV